MVTALSLSLMLEMHVAFVAWAINVLTMDGKNQFTRDTVTSLILIYEYEEPPKRFPWTIEWEIFSMWIRDTKKY